MNGKLLECGVPQGSLTGPLLFNIFINDLLFFTENVCSVYNYADDNSLAYQHKDPDILVNVLENASTIAIDWFNDNFMQANPSKFQAITLCGRNPNRDLVFQVNGATIPSLPEVKLLGVTIDNKLSFIPHVSNVCQKASKQVNALSRLSKYLSYKSRFNVYNAFVRSNFTYCSSVYYKTGRTNERKLEKVHERAIRAVANDFTSPYSDVLSRCNVLMFYDQHEMIFIEHVFKVINGAAPPIPKDFYVMRNSGYNLRDNSQLKHANFNRVTYGFNSLHMQGAILWNHLPCELKDAESLSVFKTRLKMFKSISDCSCGTCFKCTYRV